MRQKLYGVYDRVAGRYVHIAPARNNSEFIRTNIRGLLQIFPLPDLDLYELGDFDDEDVNFNPQFSLPHIVSWEDYKFPETQAENLAPLKIPADQLTKDEKNASKKEQEKTND